MKSKVLPIAICASILAVLLVLPGPAGGTETGISGFQNRYSAAYPDIPATLPCNLSKWSSAVSLPSPAIRQLRSQIPTPPAADTGIRNPLPTTVPLPASGYIPPTTVPLPASGYIPPTPAPLPASGYTLPTPVPAPTPERTLAVPTGYTGKYDTGSLIAQYSSQTDAIWNSLKPQPGTQPAPSGPGSGDEVVQANNRFALDLYTRLAGEEDGNIFFSPFSISSALAITYEGARGRTADEIRQVFHFPDDSAVMREGFAETNAGINSGSSAFTLRTANALWAEQTCPFLPEYTGTAGRYYSAKTTNLDFIRKPDESRVTINRWVEEQTEEKIRDLLPPGSIDPWTRLVITNAIYFKGTWVKQFDPSKTTGQNFRTGSGTVVQVPMMQRTDEEAIYGYTETDLLQVLSMPYESDGGKALSMLVILPKGDDLETIEAALDAAALADLRQGLVSRQVMVYFPKFTTKTKYSLPSTLSAMGMPTAFSGAADFSGMDGTRNLAISDVIHQAFLEVNEEGTEAAAATAVVIRLTSAGEPAPVFRADHPFIFLILDDETGNILFMGRVTNPAGT